MFADGAMPPGETNPFIMLASGVGQLFSPDVVDGPFPEHYEPVESPVRNLLSKTQSSPCAQVWKSSEFDRYGTPDVLPDRRDHVPRLRALADRRHEPQHALARGPGAARRSSRSARRWPSARGSRTATG